STEQLSFSKGISMNILSINIGSARTITRKGVERVTGIYKNPVEGPVGLTTDGLAGDVIVDKKHHGGPDQAVYIYGQVDYDYWTESLGETLPPGTFGENLTISGLASADYNVGDTLQIGSSVLQVTAPRIPCATLSARMGDSQFVKKFRQAERPGMYCRVLETGLIQAGDRVRVVPYTGETISLIEMYRDAFDPDTSPAALRRFLAAPIDIRSRQAKEMLLD
ncbi:MAG: MOSC domain-containing protein, partial [Anaerolineales bacterium]